MAATRKQIMEALFDQLKADATVQSLFPTISRRFVMWEQLPQAIQSGQNPMRQPALFSFDGVGLGGGTDSYDNRTRSLPPVVTMRRTLVIYAQIPNGGEVQGPNATTPGGDVFYPLIEAVIAVINAPDDQSSNANTLGGLVSHCCLKGDGIIITGEIDGQGQGMATLPIEIMMYPSQ